MMGANTLCKCQIHPLSSCFSQGLNWAFWKFWCLAFLFSLDIILKKNQTSQLKKIRILTTTLSVFLLVYCWKDRWQLFHFNMNTCFSIFTRYVCFHPPHIFPNIFEWHLRLSLYLALICSHWEKNWKSPDFSWALSEGNTTWVAAPLSDLVGGV